MKLVSSVVVIEPLFQSLHAIHSLPKMDHHYFAIFTFTAGFLFLFAGIVL